MPVSNQPSIASAACATPRAPKGCRLRLQNWGVTDYKAALQGQTQLWQALLEAGDDVRDGYLVVTQHPTTVTLGKSERGDGLLADAALLEKHGASVYRIDRGGKSTIHNPGQIVVYPIVPLRRWRMSVKCFVNLLEKAMRDTCIAFGIQAKDGSTQGLPVGCWVEERKIGQIGIQVSRGITKHGLSFNVANDLKDFDLITPCGLPGVRVSSLAQECRDRRLPVPELQKVEQSLIRQLAQQLEIEVLE